MLNTCNPIRSGWLPSRRNFVFGAGAVLALHAARLRAASAPAGAHSPCLMTSHPFYPPSLQTFIDMLDPAADVFVGERYVAEIQPLLDAWTTLARGGRRTLDALRRSLHAGFEGSSLQASETTVLRDSGPLRIEKRRFKAACQGRDAFLRGWQGWLGSLREVNTLELEIFAYSVSASVPLRMETSIAYTLTGTDMGGRAEQRSGTWDMGWSAEESQPSSHAVVSGRRWTVRTWTAGVEVRSLRSGPGFTEITSNCLDPASQAMAQLVQGIDHWRTMLDSACGIDVFGNQGIAVGDLDGNGYESFYICQSGGLPNRLFRNRGDGRFEDITEHSGTGLIDGSASALFADFRNRGLQDLLVVRSAGPLLFENMGNGRFVPRPEAFQFARPPQGAFTSAAAADYNRDGFVDVYLCVYSYAKGLDHHQYPSPYYDAQNGPPNFLFRNRGDGTFEDVTVSSGMDQNNNRFSFAASWCDDSGSGWPDLYVANDFGRKNLYRNRGNGTFTDVAAAAGVEDYGPGMSVCRLDVDRRGREDLYVANMWLAEGLRITADEHFLPGVDPAIRAIYRKDNAGNSMYANRGDGTFSNRTEAAGTAKCGWSWSCAAWDFDHDGWDDLCVANGFVSGPRSFDLQSFFWRQVAQRSMTPSGEASSEYEAAWNAINELLRSDYSWSGRQRNVFFANLRDGVFANVAGALGLDLIDDCRAFSLADIDGDGRLEVIFKNRTGPQVRILRNDLEGLPSALAVRLHGVRSNRDAIGASVTVQAGGMRQTKFVAAGSGFASQHTRELFFGLGDWKGELSIEVRWPSGVVDRHEHVASGGRIRLKEGSSSCEVKPFSPSLRPSAVTAAARAPSAEGATIRTWLIQPLVVPDLTLRDFSGQPRSLTALRGRPVLVTFLRSGCDGSLRQTRALLSGLQTLSAAGIELFVVAMTDAQDAASPTSSIDADLPPDTLELPVAVANQHTAGAWNVQFRYLFDRRRDMPIPASFLLNASGECICVYQGVILPAQVAGDLISAPQNHEQRMARALPFSGPYYGPPMAHDYLSFGIAFAQAGFEPQAQKAFQQAIAADPGLEVAWFNLGTSFLHSKDYGEACRCLTEAVRLDSGDSDAWNNLGSAFGAQSRYEDALNAFRRAVFADPHHANAVSNMMRIYEYQARPTDAERTLRALIIQAPGIAQLHLELSLTLVAQNEWEQARGELETAVRLDPHNPDALNNLGAVLLHLGFSSEALERFRQCRKVAPDFSRAVINVALVQQRMGDFARARQTLREFLVTHPNDADIRAALDRMGPS